MRPIKLLLLLLLTTCLYSQENCFNGIDDDNDGQIDLNDDDCVCDNNSLVNGSFDGPCSNFSVEGWNTYYNLNYTSFSACNILNIDQSTFPAPAAEVVQLTSSTFAPSANVYQCLGSPLQAGGNYSFSYDYAITSGFLVETNPPPSSEILIYGIVNCPQDYDAQPLFCPPSNVPPGLELIDLHTFPAIFDTWNSHSFSFTPSQNYEGILIAAPCYSPDFVYMLTQLTNVFLDGGLIIDPINPFFSGGTACTQLTASADLSNVPVSNVNVQWFLDGVAIDGATNIDYQIPYGTTGELSFGITTGGICGYSESISIPLPITLDISGVTSDNPCFEENLGEITLNLNNGTPNYDFLWSNGSVTQNLSGLADGQYFVTVTDSEGCTGEQNFTISSPPLLMGDISNITEVDPISQFGSATASASGGSPTYQYLWSNGVTTSTNNTLSSGIHQVTITDDNGCIDVLEVEIPIAPLTAEIDVTPSCADTCTGVIVVNVIGGIFPYTYSWSDNSNIPELRTDLCPGEYTLIIEDQLGTTATYEIEMNNYPAVNLIYNVEEPTCNDSVQLGNILLAPEQNISRLSFKWSNGSTEQSLVNVPPSNYNLVTRDQYGCTNNYSFEITETLPFNIEIIQTNPTCVADSNGTIELITTPNTSIIDIVWDSGQTSAKIIELKSGNYSATVTDQSTGCQEEINVELPIPVAPQFVVDYSKLICPKSDDGFINITSLDTGLQSVTWNIGGDGLSLENLVAGSYTATIVDTNACERVLSFEIDEYQKLEFNAIAGIDSCNLNNGLISIDTLSPFFDTIIWNDIGLSGLQNQGLSGEKWYLFEMIDTNSCRTIDSIFVDKLSPITYSISTIDTICTGSIGGVITISSDIPSSVLFQLNNDTIINNLAIGTYEFDLIDINGCITEDSVIIKEYQKPDIVVTTIDESCSGNNDGLIEIDISSNVSINWLDDDEGLLRNNLSTGSYYFTIVDENNCSYLDSAYVKEGLKLSLLIDEVQPIACLGDTGIYVLDIIDNQYVTFDGKEVETDTLLITKAGIYNIIVSDTNKVCYFDTSIVVNITSSEVKFDITQPDCGNANGAITVLDENQTIVDFSWSNNSPTLNQNNISPGNYTLIYSDAEGCSYSEVLSIQESSLPTLTYDIREVLCAGDQNGSITLYADDIPVDSILIDVSPYSNGSETLGAGDFQFSYIDIKGCEQEGDFTIPSPPPIQIDLLYTKNDTFGRSNGEAAIAINGGSPPFQVTWNNGMTGDTIVGLPAGSYTAQIIDANSCISAIDITILNLQLKTAVAIENESCQKYCDGSISLEISADFDYDLAWSDGKTGQKERSNLCPGDYSYYIIDKVNRDTLYFEKITINQGDSVPKVTIIPDADTLEIDASVNLKYQITPQVDGRSQWIWKDESICEDCDQILINDQTGVITLLFSSEANCLSTDSIFLYKKVGNRSFILPNVISLGRGNNSFWTFPIPDYMKDLAVSIYDRWGNKVYSEQDNISWDGKFNGEWVATGVYVAKLTYYDRVEKKEKVVFQDITVVW